MAKGPRPNPNLKVTVEEPRKKATTWTRFLLGLRVLAWGGVLVGVAWGGRRVEAFLVTDPRFTLECEAPGKACASLEIHGNVYAGRHRLQSVFEGDFGKSLVSIPLRERRLQLLAIDWVNSVTISRVWPNRLVLTITEREPVAFAKIPVAMGRYRMELVDDDGVLLSIPPRVKFQLPVVSGLSEDQSEAARKVRVHAARHLLEDLGAEAKDVSEVNAAGVHDMRVIADAGGRAVELWVGDQHFRSRFVNFLNHYDQIRQTSDAATVFDLKTDDRISAIR